MDFLGVGPLELIFILIIAILVIGPRDIEKGEVSIRDMSDKSTDQVKLEQVVEYLVKKIQ